MMQARSIRLRQTNRVVCFTPTYQLVTPNLDSLDVEIVLLVLGGLRVRRVGVGAAEEAVNFCAPIPTLLPPSNGDRNKETDLLLHR